jgi:hypothetical protein
MYNYPVLFPVISNRETWFQIIQIVDDQTGDSIALTDSNNNPLYGIFLEISPPEDGHGGFGNFPVGYHGSNAFSTGFGSDPVIFASLENFITIPDVGTIQVQIPFSVMHKLRGTRTYNVYLRIVDFTNDDARQILIGKLPVAFGGRGGVVGIPRGTIP